MKKQSKKFAVIDAETDPFLFGREPKPFIWGWYDGTKFLTFTDTQKFSRFLSQQKITVYCHNGGKFDYHFLSDYINSFEKISIINGRLSKMRLGKCTLVDSYNILPIALADYQKDVVDYALFEEGVRDAHMEYITDYLRNDCVYLYDIVFAYRDEYGADLTQAGGAIKTWSKIAGDKPPRHNDAGLFAHFKQYYFGGRVECFKTGIINKKFNVYDINSAYPFAMTYSHPYGLEYLYGDREIPFQADTRVFYRLECASLGAFPYREKPQSGLCFPNDGEVREFCVTDWEYWTAKNAGLLKKSKIIECVVFSDTRNFSDYVMHFYNGRKQAKRDGDREKDLLYKLRLNSLYGKFGSDYRRYENYMILPDDFNSDDWENNGNFGADNSLFSQPLPDDELNFYNVNTAASITGFVRAYLLAAIVRTGRDNMLYCDTDCIVTHSNSGLNLGGELGEWKDEGEFSRAGIAGKKLYIFESKNGDTKKASKGVKLTDSELWKVCSGETVTHRKDSPSFSVTGKVRFQERKIKITA